MTTAFNKTGSTLRRNLQEVCVLNGLIWMLVVAGVGTAGDALVESCGGPDHCPAVVRAGSHGRRRIFLAQITHQTCNVSLREPSPT